MCNFQISEGTVMMKRRIFEKKTKEVWFPRRNLIWRREIFVTFTILSIDIDFYHPISKLPSKELLQSLKAVLSRRRIFVNSRTQGWNWEKSKSDVSVFSGLLEQKLYISTKLKSDLWTFERQISLWKNYIFFKWGLK